MSPKYGKSKNVNDKITDIFITFECIKTYQVIYWSYNSSVHATKMEGSQKVRQNVVFIEYIHLGYSRPVVPTLTFCRTFGRMAVTALFYKLKL